MSVVDAVIQVLETYVSTTSPTPSISTNFHTNRPPNISIRNYLRRLEQYMKCTPESYIVALIYLDRVTAKKPEIVLSNYCIHRLFLTALIISVKFYEDKYFKNSYYGKVGGIPGSEVNVLEHEFLICIDFCLYVKTEEYENYLNTLLSYFENGGSS